MELLAPLSDALGAAPWLAGTAAFVWGLLSIWLSPCHLAGIPLVVGYLAVGNAETARRWAIIVAFALGALGGLVPLAAVTLGMGRLVGDLGGWGSYLAAAACIAGGLYLLGALPLPAGRGLPTPVRRGPGMAFLLGAAFGFALGPCAFAWIAPVLGAAWLAAARDLLPAVLLLILFATGHCLAVLLAATSLERVQRWLDALGRNRGLQYGRAACGGLLLVGGGYLLAAGT
jgi:cytochrome c-type biogenesis protein